MADDIVKKNNEWNRRLEGIQFVGEIAISRDELLSLGNLLGSRVTRNLHDHLGTALVVLATNCAYHEYDETGFWPHFFRVLGVPQKQQLEKSLGEQIESWLLERKFIQTTRTQSFRFVGPILRQSGITRKHLKKFAEFMKDLSKQRSWYSLETCDFETYSEWIPKEASSKYLTDFLRDKWGWEFSRDVARGMRQISEELINTDTLKSSAGYRPGFWDYFLLEFQETYIEKEPVQKNICPLPKLKFLIDRGHISLVFDPFFVRKKTYVFDSRLVDDPVVILDESRFFKEKIPILVRNEGGVESRHEINGWSPEKVNYAIFSGQSGCYLTHLDASSSGEFHLIIPEGVQPPEEVLTNYLGPIRIGSKRFRGWTVCTKSVSDLTFIPEFSTSEFFEKKFPEISWSNTPCSSLRQADLHQIFSGERPKLIVRNTHMIHDSRMFVSLNLDGVRKKLEIPMGKDPVTINLDVPVPSRGEVRVEAVGRFREFSQTSRDEGLYFCLIPKCSINWPEGLLQHNEKPIVKFNPGEKTQLILDRCRPNKSDPNLWELPENSEVINGQIISGSVTANIYGRIYRSDIIISGQPTKKILTKDELLQGIELQAKGYPKKSIRISLLTSNNGMTRLADLGNAGGFGTLSFNSRVFSDALARVEDPLGFFAIDHNGRNILCPTIFVDEDKIIDLLISDTTNSSWYDESYGKLSENLDAVYRTLNGLSAYLNISICDQLPYKLSTWCKKLLIGQAVIGDKGLKDTTIADALKHLEFSDCNFVACMNWFRTRKAFLNNQTNGSDMASKLFSTYVETREKNFILPEWVRLKWGQEFDEIESRISEYFELEKLLEKWSQKVKDEETHSSLCDAYSGGKALTVAWKNYYKSCSASDEEECLNKAFKYAASPTNLRSPLKELALFLKGIVALKKCLFDEADFALSEDYHPKMLPHLETINYLSRLFRGLEPGDLRFSLDAAIEPAILPLHSGDAAIMSRKFLKMSDTEDSIPKFSETEWLMNLSIYCHSRFVNDRNRLQWSQQKLMVAISTGDYRAGVIKKILEQKHYARG